MASKYDAYWGGQLHRIREGLQLAVTGAAVVVSVPDLARLGERQSWHGIAEVRGQELINSSGAHVTSLGRQIAASGICQQWPQRTFRFMIGTDGGVRPSRWHRRTTIRRSIRRTTARKSIRRGSS